MGSLATNVGLLQLVTDAWLTSTFGSAACSNWIRVKLSCTRLMGSAEYPIDPISA